MNILSNVRPSTLSEREAFYRRFSARKAFAWARSIAPHPVFAVNLGWYTGLVKPGLERYLKRGIRTIYLYGVNSPKELRRKLLRYLPESVYYWRNVVSDADLCRGCALKFNREVPLCFHCPNFLGQELMFDIDPVRHGERYGYSDFLRARFATLRLVDALLERFSKVSVVFSGRGFHIHVGDPDAFCLSPLTRRRVAEELGDPLLDIPVTYGSVSLARLPYTLNALVNAVAVPVNIKKLDKFDPYHSSSSSSSS